MIKSTVERDLDTRLHNLHSELGHAAQKLGRAWLEEEFLSQKPKKETTALERKVLQLESDIKRVNTMFGAIPSYLADQRDAAYARKSAMAVQQKVDREVIARALSQPSKARQGSKEDYEREKTRFKADFDKLKETAYLMPRAEELLKLAKSCGGIMHADARSFLNSYGRFNNLF